MTGSLARENVARVTTGEAWAPPTGRPHAGLKAKRVIWLFMRGGVSHLESFYPKPEIDKYGGRTIAETPNKTVQNSPWLKANQRVVEGEPMTRAAARGFSKACSSSPALRLLALFAANFRVRFEPCPFR